MIDQLAKEFDLKDRFGFSIYITLLDKALSLGSGRSHLMDAISNCEQYMKEQGITDKSISWRLMLRKEIFTPWYNPGDCEVATELIFKQILAGVSSGEFRCKSEREVATFGALVYYAEHGNKLDPRLIAEVISKYLPEDLRTLGKKSVDKWTRAIENAFQSSPKIQHGMTALEAKEDIVIFAQISWTMLFSRFYECVQFEGPVMPTKSLILAINCNGIFFLNDQEEVILELSFPEILSTSFEERDRVDNIYICTVQAVTFGFKCFEARQASSLIDFLLNGLKKRSTYAVAIQNYSHPDNSGAYLKLMKGDLIKFGQRFPNEQWAFGESRGKQGDFPTEAVHVLPCIVPPTEAVLELFKVFKYHILKLNVYTSELISFHYRRIVS